MWLRISIPLKLLILFTDEHIILTKIEKAWPYYCTVIPSEVHVQFSKNKTKLLIKLFILPGINQTPDQIL